jgi:plastocyanin
MTPGISDLKFRISNLALLLAVASMPSIAGCGDSSSAPDLSTLPAPTFGDATVRGSVTLAVDPPAPKLIARSAEQCHASAKPAYTESVVVGPDKGLANAIVYLKIAPASTGKGQPLVEIDQVNCVYAPHVSAVQIGQTLRIRNGDPVYHNTRWDAQSNDDLNFDLKQKDDYRDLTFPRAEFLRLRCDAHPWMEAWVGVMQNPFFTVTDPSGQFELKRVPAGTYTVGIWHEFYGEQERTITVVASGVAELKVEVGK